ncbi:hypothetical protein [Hydrogenispora ethanolica]|uniref:hypothetical protein n=1 Tax=Hydrogenispora ethanolica TaxID=1082276 RepID=UPI00104436B3|nr:hypothetical protein [Hydrogenispora ethanolica]
MEPWLCRPAEPPARRAAVRTPGAGPAGRPEVSPGTGAVPEWGPAVPPQPSAGRPNGREVPPDGLAEAAGSPAVRREALR